MTTAADPASGAGPAADSVVRRNVATTSDSPSDEDGANAAINTASSPGGRGPAKARATYFGPAGKLRPFRLLRGDAANVRRRWLSDWAVLNQQVVASAVYIFFTNILPGITFASDLYVLTGKSWGTIEVVFSTGLCGVVFALFSAQPLTILGVTGPFSVLAENIYKLCQTHFHVDFLSVMAWTLIHAGWMQVVLAVFNAHDWTMQYVTHFSADIFSLLNSVIYFHKAGLELQRARDHVSLAAFLYAVQTTFRPSSPDRAAFLVPFWTLPVSWVFLSIIPAAIITVLFFFDHEISSIICTVGRYGTRKPGGFAWDIVLLGLTTLVCGVLGIPPANGLLPQAPLHSESLLYYETVETGPQSGDESPREPAHRVPRTHEQRYSAFFQAALILIFVSPPFQRLLGLAQTSVLAGLFLFMGYQSLSVNPILERVANILTPRSQLPELPSGVTWLGIHCYTVTQIVLTAIVFAITLTVAAPAFPLVIIALVPVRLTLMNRIWSRETLRVVDGWACRPGKPEDQDQDATSLDLQTTPSDEEKGK
ncbi:hypothetical protein HIM_04778 [Hirsutella minnesotensis 3608]|uniref:Bicarbonate transporter-like transmembrane domain-containing protein n=1 Tax=Hirsutella minnesotensis 3608 TaxID=1043627 RepID=A0A0F8A5U8_9HYPO|nr:hypothetical protein HIM_04778 [Hirsutella minnesotensis 3608]